MSLLRAALYVDGFNLYHSIDDFNDDKLKWLSLWALGQRIIPKQQEQLVWCGYYSALATQFNLSSPDIIRGTGLTSLPLKQQA